MAEIGLNYSIDEDGIVRLQKDLNYLLTHLDHQNVRTLHTEFCDIRSALGETQIDGPVLKMFDSSGVMRLFMGYDSSNVSATTATSDFVFRLFDANGAITINLNSSGQAIFSGIVQTFEDVYVGRHLVIGSSVQPLVLSTDESGLYITYPGTTRTMLQLKTTEAPIGGTTTLIVAMRSSESIWINAYKSITINSFSYTSGTTIENSTDYLIINSIRLFLGTSGYTNPSTVYETVGTFLGRQEKNTYLSPFGLSSNRIATEGFVRHWDIETDLIYFAGRNTKTVWSSGSTALTPNTTVNTGTTNSTNGIVMRSPAKIKSHINTSGSYVMAYASITSLDLTAFNDNSPATSDDYIVFIFHIDSTAIVSTSWGVFFQIGQDASTCYTYKHGSTYGYPFTTGFNVFSRKIGAYSTINGVPNFNDIKYVRFGFMTANTATTGFGICPDYVGIHRAANDDGTTWNDFQVEKNSTWINKWDQVVGADKFMVASYSTEIALIDIIPNGSVLSLYEESTRKFTNFDLQCEFRCSRDGYSPAFMWKLSSGSSNNVTAFINANVLTLNVYVDAVLTQYTQNISTLNRNSLCKFRMTKDYGGYIRLVYQESNIPGTIRTIFEDTPFPINAPGNIGFGSAASTAHSAITKLQYGHYNG